MKLSVKQAAELAGSLLGGENFHARRFGVGKFSDVFAVEGGGKEYVLRVAPDDSVLQLFYEYRMMRQEPAIHKCLLSETEVPVPAILAHDFSRTRIDRDFLIMPHLPGVPLSEVALSADGHRRALFQWGQYVRQIHSVIDRQNRFGYLGEHRCMDPQPDRQQAFAIMYQKLLGNIADCGVYDKQTADNAMKLLEENLYVFEDYDVSRLCHGDLWVTNLLVDLDGKVTGVLDFDRACWGDIEWNLAIAEYCGVTCEPFWQGYGRHVETHKGQRQP